MSDWDDPYDGDEEHDPIVLSPQVEAVFDFAVTPPDVVSAIAAFLVGLRETLDGGPHPDHAEAVPGLPGAYTAPLAHDLGLVQYHATGTPHGPGFYVARIVRTDAYPEEF
ncbi:hypothetical protein ABZW10_31460 [Kitasatospora sp. NPDC004723]|uniref:hypothetical protein n=1 Tax=Kitasatospora sp. NPDC004723 TaxID=3154288 RepID=UPI0033AC365A